MCERTPLYTTLDPTLLQALLWYTFNMAAVVVPRALRQKTQSWRIAGAVAYGEAGCLYSLGWLAMFTELARKKVLYCAGKFYIG